MTRFIDRLQSIHLWRTANLIHLANDHDLETTSVSKFARTEIHRRFGIADHHAFLACLLKIRLKRVLARGEYGTGNAGNVARRRGTRCTGPGPCEEQDRKHRRDCPAEARGSRRHRAVTPRTHSVRDAVERSCGASKPNLVGLPARELLQELGLRRAPRAHRIDRGAITGDRASEQQVICAVFTFNGVRLRFVIHLLELPRTDGSDR
ncbi:MAG: hypothetical protein LW806_12535 [Planctomycetaceae bacterium]|nr:hypothetical protein [Planctomycetaceae bacterium]